MSASIDEAFLWVVDGGRAGQTQSKSPAKRRQSGSLSPQRSPEYKRCVEYSGCCCSWHLLSVQFEYFKFLQIQHKFYFLVTSDFAGIAGCSPIPVVSANEKILLSMDQEGQQETPRFNRTPSE